MGYADDYIDVAQRITDFRAQHPKGSLQPCDPSNPYTIETIGNQTYIVVVAAAYRTPDDTRPGIGMAYEIFPGKTNFTRGSELQNAETSAWGRAIVAALAGDTKKSIASAEEVRNRREEQKEPPVDDFVSEEEALILFEALKRETQTSTTRAELTAAGDRVKANLKKLTQAQIKELQRAWKDVNVLLISDEIDGQIEAVSQGDLAASSQNYQKIMETIEGAKFDPDTREDFVNQLNEAFDAVKSAEADASAPQ